MELLLKYKKPMAGILLGALAGYAYWYFYGCVNGCTITGSALNSSLYFGFMGYLLSGIIRPNQPTKNESEETEAP